MAIGWGALWEKTIKESSLRKKRRDIREIERLNQSAERLFKKRGREVLQKGTSKNDKIDVEFCRMKRFINPDSSVLDIGAGTGRLAIPLAKMVKNVTVVEPARIFMMLLRENAERERIDNIEFVENLWTDFQPRKKYDLVYATWSPSIRDPAALMKMHRSSCSYCALEMVASPYQDWDFYGQIYPMVMEEDFRSHGNYLNILTTLYEHEIYANLETWEFKDEIKYTGMKEALGSWENGLSDYVVLTERTKELLGQYYRSMMNSDGSYTYPVKGVSCMIWWKV